MTSAANIVKSKYIEKNIKIYKMLPIMQSCRGKLHHSVAQVILYNYLHIALWESYSGKWKYVYLIINYQGMYVCSSPTRSHSNFHKMQRS